MGIRGLVHSGGGEAGFPNAAEPEPGAAGGKGKEGREGGPPRMAPSIKFILIGDSGGDGEDGDGEGEGAEEKREAMVRAVAGEMAFRSAK